MLKYKYRLKISNGDNEIKLNDFFVSSDLSYISGTTLINSNLSINDTLWVDCPFFSTPQKVSIVQLETVRRNGYILYKEKLDIQYTTYHNDVLSADTIVKYVNYNGNTYFQDFNENTSTIFVIDGKSYTLNNDATSFEIDAKAYVENDTVNVNGFIYNVIIGKTNETTTFYDTIGEPYHPKNWDLMHVTPVWEYIQKIQIGNSGQELIQINNIDYYGYQAYITYQGMRYDLEKIYGLSDKTEYGVYIGNDAYVFPFALDEIQYLYRVGLDGLNFYDRKYFFGVKDIAEMAINGIDCSVEFEPKEGLNGDLICIETKSEREPITLNDIITIKGPNQLHTIETLVDSLDNEYVYFNGIKYNVIKHLCDTVTIDSSKYILTYIGDCSHPVVGMIAYCLLDDKTTVYFQVNELTSAGNVKNLQKVKLNDDGGLVPSYTMVLDDTSESMNATTYSSGKTYVVNYEDGISVYGEKIPVITYHQHSSDGELVREQRIVEFTAPSKYELQVIDVVGSNKFICKPNINEHEYNISDYEYLLASIMALVVNNDSLIVTLNNNSFGNKSLTVDRWVLEAIEGKKATSIYELANIEDNIKIKNGNSSFNIPLSLVQPISNSFNREDLILGQYYDDVAESAINKIVDMEKDMYSPVSSDEHGNIVNIEQMIFNLHFRTRDLDTWQINKDEGYYFDGEKEIPFNINTGFTNWFITDYYPYNQCTNSASTLYNNTKFLNGCMNRSDLLGCLYFTTDDIRRKRNKLTGSFLRLTYFDSIDPNTQNMLGTSTLYFDCDKFYDIMYGENKLYHYEIAASYSNARRINGSSYLSGFTKDDCVIPSVLTECYQCKDNQSILSENDLYIDDSVPTYNSQIIVTDKYNTKHSSEGFYTYILKYFGNKKRIQTVYMKAEFFHAGIGIKVPMVIATDNNGDAISEWTMEKLETFKKGYELNEKDTNLNIHKRLYVPINISYSKNLRKFIYSISSEHKYNSAIQVDNTTLRFNLFELKTKTQ